MRSTYSVIYILMICALFGCTVLAHRSDRRTSNAVAFLESALILPTLGNLLILLSQSKGLALLGCYTYYIGVDFTMYALVNFTNQYCQGTGDGHHKPTFVYCIIIADIAQLLLNLFFGHAFTVEQLVLDGALYYKPVPYVGQTIHRLLMYAILFFVLLIFILVAIQVPKISRERFTVLIAVMFVIGSVQAVSIIARTNIDRSVIGYGFFGMVLYWFAIRYRPIRLLDHVLSLIVSGFSDAFYIFDPNGNCIWANEQGCRLVGVTVAEGHDYDFLTAKLRQMFGDPDDPHENSVKRKIGEGEDARFYILEEKQVKDSRGRVDGTYLRIQDVTEGEQQLQERDEQIGQISQEAYRDPLTGVGSKAAYIRKVTELNGELETGQPQFAVAMVDMNNLKQINDDHGHKAGDLYIRGCCHLICEVFKHSPVFRIGGDEFIAILQGHDYENRLQLAEQLRKAFADAFAQEGQEPWARYSAAVGMAENASDDITFELVFKRADKAMYEDKKIFKQKYGSYR